MIEHPEDPVGHASGKIVQYVSLVTMAAEALAQRAQQRTAMASAAEQRTAAAARAEQTSARNAARLQWQPVLDPRRGPDTSLGVAGLAWAVSQAWQDVDPEAALASDRALERMRVLRPDVMARFDRLTGEGLGPVEAMRRVAPFFDRPAAREHGGQSRKEVTVGAPHAGPHAGDVQLVDQTAGEVVDRGPLPVDADPFRTGVPLHDTAALPSPGVHLHGNAGHLADLVLVASGRTQPQLAHDAYPERLTGEVLAAGKVKPKTPDRTAPAAVRSASLATAARATGSRRR